MSGGDGGGIAKQVVAFHKRISLVQDKQGDGPGGRNVKGNESHRPISSRKKKDF